MDRDEPTMDLDELDDYLGGIKAASQARIALRLAEMEVAGLEPSPDDFTILGMHLFGIAYRFGEDDVVEVRLNVHDENVWGLPYPDRGTFFKAGDFLDAIVAAWSVIGRSYTNGLNPSEGRTVLAPEPVKGERDLLLVINDGKELMLGVGEARHRYGKESVIVAQCLMSFADILANHLGRAHESTAAWEGWRSDIDLPPLDGLGEHEVDNSHGETVWAAAKAGLPLETYCLAAIDVLARQMISSKDKTVPEPEPHEWYPTFVPQDLDPDRIRERARLAAEIICTTRDTFEVEAVSGRNSEVFQVVFYRGGIQGTSGVPTP